MLAAKNGHKEVVELLITEDANFNINNNDTPLMLAAENGQSKIVECLLSAGADVKHQNKKGNNALMCGAANGHLDIVKNLINNVDVNLTNQDGNTALMCAAKNGHLDVFSILILNFNTLRCKC